MKISNKKNKTFLDQKYKYVELDPVDKQFNNKNIKNSFFNGSDCGCYFAE